MSVTNVNAILNDRAAQTINGLRQGGVAALQKVLMDRNADTVSVTDLALIISGRKSKSVETKVRRQLAAAEAAKLLGPTSEQTDASS